MSYIKLVTHFLSCPLNYQETGTLTETIINVLKVNVILKGNIDPKFNIFDISRTHNKFMHTKYRTRVIYFWEGLNGMYIIYMYVQPNIIKLSLETVPPSGNINFYCD